MNLLKLEIKKLFCRKTVFFMILLTIFIQITNFIFFDYTWGYSVIDNNGIVTYVNGQEAINLRKQIGKQFYGELDKSLYEKIDQAIFQSRQKYANYTQDEQQNLMRKFNDQKAILKYFTGDEINKIFIGYCDGWSKFITNFSNIIVLCIIILLIGGLSGIFANEYETHMMYLLSASPARLGRLVKVKYLSAYIYTVLMFTVLFSFNLLLYAIYYGLSGAECNIQASAIYVASSYSFTFGQLAMFAYLGGILGSITIASLITFISLVARKTSLTMITSFLILISPLLFDFSDSMPKLQKCIELLPSYFINAKEVYQKTNLFWGQPIQPILSTSICLILSLVLYTISRKKIIKIEIID